MFRMILVLALILVLFLAPPQYADARCGGGASAGGLFARGGVFGIFARFRARLAQRQASRQTTVYAASAATAWEFASVPYGTVTYDHQIVAPQVIYGKVGNCPGGICPIR